MHSVIGEVFDSIFHSLKLYLAQGMLSSLAELFDNYLLLYELFHFTQQLDNFL